MTIKVNLKSIITELVSQFTCIESVYFFGSRRFGSRSVRSDIDILLAIKAGEHLKASDSREFIANHCCALDLFLLEGGKATSCMNDSFVYGDSSDDLIHKLGALQLWTSSSGFSDQGIEWEQEISEHATYPDTAMPNEYLDAKAFDNRLSKTEASGLPIKPYIGDTIEKASDQIIEVIENAIIPSSNFSAKGRAKDGWPSSLQSEYDCHDLIYFSLKPWLRSVPREDVTIKYDDQEKSADFNLFQSQLIIEAKYIDSSAKKREVVKTLRGLSEFYKQNANVKVLIMIIFHTIDSIDVLEWESNYTYSTQFPRVITKLIRVQG